MATEHLEIGAELETIPMEVVFQKLKYASEGLLPADVLERRNRFGQNKLEEKKESKAVKFLGFMWNPPSWVMEFAAVVTAVNGFWGHPDWLVLVGIIVLLLVNSTISFIVENNAEKAAAALMAQIAPKVKVHRNAVWIDDDVASLVPGDIITIELGNIIPADARLLEGDPIEIDKESVPKVPSNARIPEGDLIERDEGDEPAQTERSIQKVYGDVVYSGSTVTQGKSKALVIATGVHTVSGKAAHLIDSTKQVRHFQTVLTHTWIFCLCSILVPIILEIIVMYFVQHRGFRSGIHNLTVLLIGGFPITMPIVLSVKMATGSKRLSQKGAIAKSMTAIEDMARMDVLCTDITGTLTLNELIVDKELIKVVHAGYDKNAVLLMAARASALDNQDDIDAAILGTFGDSEEPTAGITASHILPFNQTNQSTVLTFTDTNNEMHRVSKGAPEKILNLASNKSEIEDNVRSDIAAFEERGLQSVGVAYQEVPEGENESPGGPWEFIGLLPLLDPPRDDSKATISGVMDLGVSVKMITGDQLALLKEIGHRLDMGTNMFSSSDGLPDDATIEKVDGFANVLPGNKEKIVERLQAQNHICGMTGDGVNDAPTLKRANIGIAVAYGTDVARSASDIVLRKPGLSVIIDAVSTSREIVLSIKNHRIYALSITVNVYCFVWLALQWGFDFPPSMALIIVIQNYVTAVIASRDRMKPSSLPESWNPAEIFITGFFLGIWSAMFTVCFFWIAYQTKFIVYIFHVYTLEEKVNKNFKKMASVIFLQVSIINQALIFVTRSRRWSLTEHPGLCLSGAFVVSQTIATLIAVYANWRFAAIEGIGWQWAGIIWLYNIIPYILLEAFKFVTLAISSGKAWDRGVEQRTASQRNREEPTQEQKRV